MEGIFTMTRNHCYPRRFMYLCLIMSTQSSFSWAQWACPVGGCESSGLAPVVHSTDADVVLQEMKSTAARDSDKSVPRNGLPEYHTATTTGRASLPAQGTDAYVRPSYDTATGGNGYHDLWRTDGWADECTSGACPVDCLACEPVPCGCQNCGGCLAGFEVFGEFLYLRPRNGEVAYAVPVDGPIAPVLNNGIPVGDTRVADVDYRGGFRFGVNAVTTICGRLTGQWTRFQSHDNDQFSINPPDVIRSLVTHPLGGNAASDGLQTSASLDINFDLIDLAVQTPLCRRECWAADLVWGVRYGRLEQQFQSEIDVNGQTFVNTDIDFDGVGPRVGLLGQRNLGRGTLYAFGRGEASFLVGSFDATYAQQDVFAGQVVNTGWDAGRVVPQLEMELGLGWCTPGGRFQVRAGYLVAAWFNAVRSNEFINAVQQGNLDGMGDGVTFDGLSLRAELRF